MSSKKSYMYIVTLKNSTRNTLQPVRLRDKAAIIKYQYTVNHANHTGVWKIETDYRIEDILDNEEDVIDYLFTLN
jgi:hypothetical protein